MKLVLQIALLALAIQRMLGGNAVFSQDGRRIYLIDRTDSTKVAVIDIEKQSVSKLDLSAFTKKKSIVALSTSKSGALLFATANGAWSYNPEKKVCLKLCGAPRRTEFDDLACNPENGTLLFSTHSSDENNNAAGAAVLTTGNPHSVWMRRVTALRGIAFSRTGELFFGAVPEISSGADGDLWTGNIKEEDSDHLYLEGIRCGPLAVLGTSGDIGVREVAIADTKLYAHLRPMHGIGSGYIARLDKPAGTVVDTHYIYPARLNLYVEQLSSVEPIGKTEGGSSDLCASRDGKRVFFRGSDGPCLIENNEKPRKINVVFP